MRKSLVLCAQFSLINEKKINILRNLFAFDGVAEEKSGIMPDWAIT